MARYDKIHLFSLNLGQERFSEDLTIEAGTRVVVVDSPFGPAGFPSATTSGFPNSTGHA